MLETMTPPRPHDVRRTLQLTSSLDELARVAGWIGELAAEFDIEDETRFAIELCLEEVLSNIVRHGYRNQAGSAITVDFECADRSLLFVVEDNAPPFAPLEPADAIAETLEAITPGGQGLRLLYRFAGAVRYERLVDGNRLTIEFARKSE
ncbi:MAG TPA: ATP-binding protein [Terracidiphilus sp.]|nr:ATP-binding protein [Terracidiphilus sp.]